MDLTFPSFPIGTHQTPTDLRILLFKGAANDRRKLALTMIDEGKFGEPIAIRVPLVCAIHEAISSMISLGKYRALVESSLDVLWRFFAWSDEASETLSKETIVNIFKRWTENLIKRSKLEKEISELYAYKQASQMASLISKALRLPGIKPGRNLMLQTRMRRPTSKKRVLGLEADKQNLNHTFEFGQVLENICHTLDHPTIRGPLPIDIELIDGKKLSVAGNLINIHLDVSKIENSAVRKSAEKARAPLSHDESLFDSHKRSGILNLRIEAELLIFIAQTGMNLTQAASLQKENYRWKSNGDDLEVFRVYKGRRSGEAMFRCYNSYRTHLDRYLAWLNETGLSENDTRLFPLLSRGMIRVKDSKVGFYTTKTALKKINIPFVGPQKLRNTRVNWLLRRTRNVELTADQMAHDKEVLLRDYERPHHQSASAEILRYHNATDPTISPPGPGICIDDDKSPEPIFDLPEAIPAPDCISPEGCLFCMNHRDVMSFDYCWKLASHARIKSMEINFHKPYKKQEAHPAYYVIDRISQKLDKISEGSEIRKMWVSESRDYVRAGRYHPYWDGHIRLLEVME